MDENILRLRVGIFVVIAMCILGILIFLNSEGWVSQYTVFIKPTSAPGVTQGTPIRKNGVLIGRVKKVTPVDAEGYVLLELGINEDSQIFANEVCSIGSESLLGDAAIKIMALPMDERGAPVRNDQTLLKVAIRRDPMQTMVDLAPQLSETLDVVQQAGKSIEEAGTQFRDLSSTVHTALQDEGSDFKALLTDLRTMTGKAQAALDNFNRMFENVNNVVGDPALKGQIKQALAELPKIFQEVRVTIADTRDTVNKFGEAADGATETFDNLEVFTASLKDQGPEVIAQVNSSLKNVDKLVNDLKQFATMLSELDVKNGSVGKLLNDTELYDSAMRAVKNIEKETVKVEAIMNDARVFMDKLARKPSNLIKGAVGPGSKADYKGSAGRDGGIRGGARLR